MTTRLTDIMRMLSLKKYNIRTTNVVKNSAYSALMKIASLCCSLLIVPITIDYLDSEKYGIWMAMTSILYWFAFFDVGLGNGMRNYLAEALSIGNYIKAQSYFSTAILILSLIAIIIGATAIPTAYLLDLNKLFNTHNIDNHYLANVLAVALIFTLILFVVKSIGIVYIAMQKYAVNDFILLLGNILSLIIVYIFTQTTEPSLINIVIVFTGVPVLMYLLAYVPLFLRYPQLRISFKSLDTDTAKKIVTKGLGFFVIQITSCIVIFGSSNLIISHYCGPEQVTAYNISYKLFNVLTIGYTILISPLWNAYTDAYVKGEYQWIKKTVKKSLLFWIASIFGGLVILGLSGWLIHLWIGDDIHIPLSVSTCILIYVCSFNLNNCVTYLINGLNKIRVQIIMSIVSTIVYIIAIYFVKGNYGIIGISLSMTAAYLLMAVVHMYQCYLLVNNKAKNIWNK